VSIIEAPARSKLKRWELLSRTDDTGQAGGDA